MNRNRSTNRTIGYWVWQTIASVVLGAAAILSLPVIYGDLSGDQGALNWFTIFLGAVVAGSLFWWLFITRKQLVTLQRGVLAAILAALTAFPLVYLVVFVLLGEVPLGLADGGFGEHVTYALMVSFISLVFGGWFTVLIAGLTGALLAFLQRRLLTATQLRAAPVVASQSGRAKDVFKKRPLVGASLALLTVVVLFVVGLGAWIWFAPLNMAGLVHAPAPVADYEQAITAIERIQTEEENAAVNPLCTSRLLDHGTKTERVIVFVHGFTNCPEQFAILAQEFYDEGYNVFIPRMPYHGLSNRLTTDLSKLSSEALVGFADDVVDVAQGLGDEVTVVGLSGGGTVTAWIAQTRADVDTAVVIAPMLGILTLPEYAVKPVANATLTLPNFFVWWDAEVKEQISGPDYAYPRYATRAVGAIMRMSALIEQEAKEDAPLAGQIIAISNQADQTVNNQVLENVLARWQSHNAIIETYQFPAEMNLPHDIIDPNQTEQQIDVVYPRLVDLITSGE